MQIKRGRLFLISSALLIGGFYILLLILYPEISLRLRRINYEPGLLDTSQLPADSSIYGERVSRPLSEPLQLETEAADDKLYDTANTLVIEKIGVVLDIIESTSSEALERGSWHRKPELGDPVKGGNFILTGHRFGFDWTPAGIARNSAFYHLDKLEPGDIITVYWEHRRYDYEVEDKQQVDPNAAWVESSYGEPRLTLYTCTLAGEHDGRIIVVARPVQQSEVSD